MAEPVLSIFGLDHHRTPIAVRECLSVTGDRLVDLLQACVAQPGVNEAVILSTCNRFEMVIAGRPDLEHLLTLLAERSGVAVDDLRGHAYVHHGRTGVRHLFRVVSSLESLVLGEYQITHQVKSAYEQARQAGHTGATLNPLFQRALAVGKDVRSQTAIGRHKLSVASVAVDLAKHILGDVSGARLLVIGAGEIAELAVTHLQAAGIRHVTVCNRGEERALALAAESQAVVIPWDQRGAALAEYDVVVCSTAAPGCVIDEAMVRAAMRRRRDPLMFLDLAVPRDVEERVARIEDVYLYNVDHLDAVVAANRELRVDEVDTAATLVDTQVEAYVRAQDGSRAALLAQVSTWFSDVATVEATRLKSRVPEGNVDELRYGLERVGNKLAHRVMHWLKQHPDDPDAERLIRELLDLPE